MSWAADAYVVKSADTDELRSRVRDLLDARAAG
jgi:DNA-binding response OmpR family regulator